MTKEELEQLELTELVRLQKLVTEIINEYESKKRAEAIAAAEQAAIDKGYSLSDLFGSKGVKKPRKVNPPKYLNPADKNQTWTGKGRQPNWLRDALENGSTLGDLEIT